MKQKPMALLIVFVIFLLLLYHFISLQRLYQLNVENNSFEASINSSEKTEVNNWFEIKQKENVAQREVIARLCSKIDPDKKEQMENSIQNFFISKKNNIGYCPVAKIATSTLAFFFLRTEVNTIEDLLPYGYDPNKSENENQLSGFFPRRVLESLIPELSIMVPSKDLNIWSSLTSLLVVRHPLDRLVSLHNNKFIGGVRDNDKDWIWMTKFIIGNYREKIVDGYLNTVTPEELVRFVIQDVQNKPPQDSLNIHWQPILQQCSLCSLNFSVYAKMENIEEDMHFFKLMANVEEQKGNIAKSNSGPKLLEPKEFWSQVDMAYINQLAKPFVYKYDLEMFGYSIQEYLKKLGLPLL